MENNPKQQKEESLLLPLSKEPSPKRPGKVWLAYYAISYSHMTFSFQEASRVFNRDFAVFMMGVYVFTICGLSCYLMIQPYMFVDRLMCHYSVQLFYSAVNTLDIDTVWFFLFRVAVGLTIIMCSLFLTKTPS